MSETVDPARDVRCRHLRSRLHINLERMNFLTQLAQDDHWCEAAGFIREARTAIGKALKALGEQK